MTDDAYEAPHPRRSRLRAIVRALLWIAGGGAALGVAGFLGLYLYFTMRLDPAMDLARLNRIPSVSFVDAEGNLIASRGSAFGEHLALSEMPAHLKAAFLSAEDRRFYDHFGLDPLGLTRAMLANFSAGRMVQGGSTITQQLARLLFLSNERSFSRKLEEMFIALWLERHFTKDQILELYLNRVYLGANANGIDAASRRYFGVPAREVSLAQAAMLAAMTRAPARFAPTSDLDGARLRASFVLDGMIAMGQLTQGEAFRARAIPAGPGENALDISVNYFVDYAADEVERLGIALDQDLIVKITIDRALQRRAQEIITETLADKGETKGVGQAAAVIMTPDGAVKAIIGGRDYIDSPFNRATQAMRQPGSAFKPFVYLAALELGLSPYTIRYDEPVDIEGWRPANFSAGYSGPVSLDEALAKSINTVAAALGQEVGISAVVNAAKRMGVQAELQYIRSLPLGTSETTLIDLTGAYAPFATGGVSVQRHVVLEVKRPDGEVLYTYEAPEAEQVIAGRIAKEMNFMLADVVRAGTGKRAALAGRPVAGKTGTSQDYRDALFVGFTADYVGGVWIGNDDNAPMDKIVGGNIPAEIWRKIMAVAHDGLPVRPIPGADYLDDPYAVAGDRGWQNPGSPGTPIPGYDPFDPYSAPYPPPPPRDEDLGEAILDWLFGPPSPPPPPRDPRFRR